MANNIFKLSDKSTNNVQIKPTDNQIIMFNNHLTRLIEYLEFHAKSGFSSRTVADRISIRNATTRASYVRILFDQLIDNDPDQISAEYDMSSEMKRIMDLTVEDVHETTMGLISISVVVEVDRILQSIIETYYSAQFSRPWWKFWG